MDIKFSNHGSICVLNGISHIGANWLDQNLAQDSQRWAGGYVVEPRYVDDIIEGAQSDGMTIQ